MYFFDFVLITVKNKALIKEFVYRRIINSLFYSRVFVKVKLIMHYITRTTLTAGCVLFAGLSWAQTGIKPQAVLLKRVIEINHYAPRPVNDSFSVSLFNTLIKTLDPQKRIFLQPEYEKLAALSTQLDDELNGNSWQFLPLLKTMYRRAVERSDSLTKAILQKPFSFITKEEISLSRTVSGTYAATVTALQQRYASWYKYLTLVNCYTISLNKEAGTGFDKVIEKNEAAVREKIKKNALHATKFTSKSMDTYLEETYLNSLAMTYDPHTNYFSQDDNRTFQEGLSTEALSFGFDMDETEDGKIVIARLAPGGPAWISGELNQQDQILQVQPEGKDITDVSLVSVEDVYELIEDAAVQKAMIKVRKQDGTIKSVTLKKAKHEQDENVIQGFILQGTGANTKKIGYMSLPDFYTTWDDEQGSGCANDMAKKIVEMKKEQISGLILDLRYNGGGSLMEALEIAGIFINDGPLMGYKDKGPKVTYLKDPNRGVIYDGPLAVLVNGQSASASEVVAAALQDYNRALIVGSNTFGKATMQQVLPMDTLSKTAQTGTFVKTTLGKLYRLNGSTAQQKGVIPDIILPDWMDMEGYRETSFPTSLKPDEVARNAYYKPLAALPVAALATASKTRQGTSDFFKQVADYSQLSAKKTITVPLQATAFEKWAAQNNTFMREKDPDVYRATKLSIHNLAADAAKLQTNSYLKTVNGLILESLLEDGYIEETFLILTDFINTK